MVQDILALYCCAGCLHFPNNQPWRECLRLLPHPEHRATGLPVNVQLPLHQEPGFLGRVDATTGEGNEEVNLEHLTVPESKEVLTNKKQPKTNIWKTQFLEVFSNVCPSVPKVWLYLYLFLCPQISFPHWESVFSFVSHILTPSYYITPIILFCFLSSQFFSSVVFRKQNLYMGFPFLSPPLF